MRHGGAEQIKMNPILMLDNEIKSLSLRVKKGDSLQLRCASFASLSDCNIDIYVEKDATFGGVFADFCNAKAHVRLTVYLEGEHSSASLRVASLAKDEDNKKFEASIVHKVGATEGLVECYGICEGASKLVFTGVSQIEKGAKGAATRQSAKIIVFDPKCLGRCSPILKIDENDVRASHAAVVGKLNDDHLFYLQSRGIDLSEARKLITQGYLMPIAAYFDEREKARIQEAISERL